MLEHELTAECRSILRQSAELARIGVFILDPASERCIDCSPELARMHGLTPAACMALLGTAAWLERLHPDDRERYRAATASARAGGYQVEYRMADGAGGFLHLREQAELVTNEAGAQRLVGCVRDLSESATSHKLLAAAAEALMDGLAIFDAEDRLVFHNRRYPEHASPVFGAALKIGERFSDIVRRATEAGAVYHPDMGERFVEQRLSHHRAPAEDQEFRIADGRWVRVRESRIEGGGRVLLTSDVTEHRAATSELEEREQRLRTIADGIPLPIVIARIRQPEILFVNALAAELFDLRVGPQAAAIRAAYVVPEDRRRLLERVCRDGRVDGFEVQLRRADGSTMWALLSARAITVAGEPALLTAVTGIDELKAMQQALRDSEARLAAFMENAPVAMYLKDLEGCYTLANPEMSKVFARPAREMVGLTAADTLAGHDLEEVVRRDREVLRTGGAVVVEEHTPALDAYSWSMAIRFPIRAGDGSISQIGGFHVDITPQKRAEAELRASEARLSAFMSNAPIGMFVKGTDGRYVMVNPEMANVIGRPAADALSLTAADVFPRDTAAVIADYDRELLLTGASKVHEHHLVERHAYAWIMSIRFPIRDHHGAITHIGGFAVDITERKAMEQALKASEQQFRVLAEAHPVPLFIIRLDDGKIMVATPPCETLLKVPLRELIGTSMLRFCADPQTSARVEERIGREGSLNGLEVLFRRADGGAFWGSLTSRLLTFEGERAMVAAIVDLTESKRIEGELDRQTALLHQNEKLSALGSLLAGVAHELNNPLSLVVGYAGLLEELAPDDATRERALKVRIAADRCARIVRTFLSMARNKPRAPGPVDLNEVVEAAQEIVAYGLRTADIAVERALAPDLPPVVGDADQLHQVLANLLINAQQALQTVPPPRRLRIATGGDGEAVWVAIADNGPGIPAAIASRIFEPFFTTKPQGVGLGVGLSVSHGIVVAHGGQIRVDSEPGSGSTFTVRLLRAQALRAAPVATDPPHGHRPHGHRRARILVVDDEPDIARLLSDILEGDGHAIAAAASGREALDWLEGKEVDLIISDLRMPDMDGPTLYRALAEQRPELLTRVVFITGDTLAADLTGFLSETGVNVIEKPLEPPDVSRRVQALLADYEELASR